MSIEVGYAGAALNEEGGTVTTPMFQAVGAADGEITFGSVVPIAAEDVDLSWNIGVQFLLYTGDTDWDNDYTWDGEKWLKDGYLDATETPIPAGQGLWVNNGTYSPVTLHVVAPELD